MVEVDPDAFAMTVAQLVAEAYRRHAATHAAGGDFSYSKIKHAYMESPNSTVCRQVVNKVRTDRGGFYYCRKKRSEHDV